MNILILNWRDIKNPAGGGAEILTHEMAKRWAKQGHIVTQFCSTFPRAKSKETIDGVLFIRKGQWWNVHFFAFFYYFFSLKKKTDIIIDEVHWFPFFAALYAPDKTIAFICEIANKLFYTLFPYPIALMWRGIEKVYLALYKDVPAMVISRSTYQDLIHSGHKPNNVVVLPMGLTVPLKIKHFPKEKNPTLIYVARLNRQKGIFDTLEAFTLIKKEISNAKLWIVGSGDEQITTQVKQQMHDLGITSSVKLFGFVSEEKKFELLSKAHILVSASVQEGWGLTVPEAGFMRTPSVVYNTQGFRDIVENNKDGLLVEPTPSELAKGIISLLTDKTEYQKMQKRAEKKAKMFSWEKTADVSLQFIKSSLRKAVKQL